VQDFAAYAMDHKRHPHCASCGGCLLDPNFSPEKTLEHGVTWYPLWCAGCMCRIKKNLPAGAKPLWEHEFVKCE